MPIAKHDTDYLNVSPTDANSDDVCVYNLISKYIRY